jgi:hypothetical protein
MKLHHYKCHIADDCFFYEGKETYGHLHPTFGWGHKNGNGYTAFKEGNP